MRRRKEVSIGDVSAIRQSPRRGSKQIAIASAFNSPLACVMWQYVTSCRSPLTSNVHESRLKTVSLSNAVRLSTDDKLKREDVARCTRTVEYAELFSTVTYARRSHKGKRTVRLFGTRVCNRATRRFVKTRPEETPELRSWQTKRFINVLK